MTTHGAGVVDDQNGVDIFGFVIFHNGADLKGDSGFAKVGPFGGFCDLPRPWGAGFETGTLGFDSNGLDWSVGSFSVKKMINSGQT